MSRDNAAILVFVALLLAWGVGMALILGSMACGSGPRRCADTMATDRRDAGDPCRRDR